MPLTTIEQEAPSAQRAALPLVFDASTVERTPFYFSSEGQPLFGCLHRCKGSTSSHGIVICAPIGHEQVHSHRTLRHLADRLAALGFAVLRFDYHGTGDSAGTPEEPRRLQRWLASIRDAAQWLRTEEGCETISLAGLRFGATLAHLYAQEDASIHSLVLWAPIIKGRRYVRELTALGLTAHLPPAAGAPYIEAGGFVFMHDTTQELGQIDLVKGSPRCQRVLIVHNDSIPKDSPLYDHFTSSSIPVQQLAYAGYEALMAEPHHTVVPFEALDGIAGWMGIAEQAGASLRTPRCLSAASMDDPGLVQESLHSIPVTASECVFGVLTEPRAASFPLLPWLVMLNAGSASRIGPGRLHVQVARRLAAQGFPVLRVDLSGLGDSVIPDLQRENDSYPASAFRDVAQICDYLQHLHPVRPIVLMGLCSGAYVAFQAAAQLPHRALIESILINPLTFYWREGMVINDPGIERLVEWRGYWKAIFKMDSWRQLLSGNTRAGFRGSLRRFVRNLSPSFSSEPAASSSPAPRPGGYGHPERKDLPGDLGKVERTPRQLSLFVSDNDPGYFLLMYHARRKAAQLIAKGRIKHHSIPAADHTFSTAQSREALIEMLGEYLQGRFSGQRP